MPKIRRRTTKGQHFDVTIGADPELFCFDQEAESVVSAHTFIPNSKWNPLVVPKGAIQYDGVAAEFNIDPAKNVEEFLRNIKHVKRLLTNYIKGKNPHITLLAMPTVHFEKAYIESLPHQVWELGCSPDWNAYTGEVNDKPDGEKFSFRSGAGHIHIGWLDPVLSNPMSEDHMKLCCELVKHLDHALVPASLMWDHNTERRKLYGKPGAFRPKPYGLEYRVLSNAWLNKNWTMRYVHDAAKAVANLYLKGVRYPLTPLKEAQTFFISHQEHLRKYKIPVANDYQLEEFNPNASSN